MYNGIYRNTWISMVFHFRFVLMSPLSKMWGIVFIPSVKLHLHRRTGHLRRTVDLQCHHHHIYKTSVTSFLQFSWITSTSRTHRMLSTSINRERNVLPFKLASDQCFLGVELLHIGSKTFIHIGTKWIWLKVTLLNLKVCSCDFWRLNDWFNLVS